MEESQKFLLNKYPRLCTDVDRVHLYPGTSFVVKRRISEDADAPAEETSHFVNMTGAQILAACDGSRTIKAIAEHLCIKGALVTFEMDCATFIKEASDRGFVELAEQPSSRATPVRVTGSTEYCTPFHISVELTNRCNLRCSYCYNSFLKDDDRLTTQELLTVLQEWRDLGLVSLELTGGEPLLHEGLWEIMEYCYRTFARIGLLTNGTLITEEKARKLAIYKKKLLVGISLDGGTAESHEATRGPGTFDRTVTGIRLLKEGGVRVRLGMVLTHRNSYDLRTAAELARSLNVDQFQFSPVISYGRGESADAEWMTGEADQTLRLLPQVQKEFADVVPEFPKVRLDKLEGMFGNCGLGHKNLVLTPSGKLKACLFLPEADYLGDVRRERLVDIFRKPIIKRFRELRNPSLERCAGCKYVQYCAGCTSRALLILEKEKRLCEWANAYAISECFPRYATYFYDAAQPRF